MKRLNGKSVHCEIDVLIDLNHAHIRFRHIRVDLHFGKIVRNRKDDWRLQTGCDRLTNVDAARNHHPIDRRRDGAMVEIGLCLVQRALFDLHVRLRLMKIGDRLVDISLRRSLLCKQFLGARCIHFRQLKRGLRVGQVALCLRNGGLKQHRIDLRNHLARFHLGIKIHE